MSTFEFQLDPFVGLISTIMRPTNTFVSLVTLISWLLPNRPALASKTRKRNVKWFEKRDPCMQYTCAAECPADTLTCATMPAHFLSSLSGCWCLDCVCISVSLLIPPLVVQVPNLHCILDGQISKAASGSHGTKFMASLRTGILASLITIIFISKVEVVKLALSVPKLIGQNSLSFHMLD